MPTNHTVRLTAYAKNGPYVGAFIVKAPADISRNDLKKTLDSALKQYKQYKQSEIYRNEIRDGLMMSIFTACTPTAKPGFLFWNSFFRACGIRVEKAALASSRTAVKNTDRQAACPEDAPEDWETPALLKTLESLFPDPDKQKRLKPLLPIFKDFLWPASWLYTNFAFDTEGPWDKKISGLCEKASAALRSAPESIFQDFMSLYCGYIHAGARDRSREAREKAAMKLLSRCDALAETRGWDLPLSDLAMRICCLSETKEKYAVFYCKPRQVTAPDAGMLFRTGRIYGKAYGDTEKAYAYYREALQADKNDCRALYHKAAILENRGKWMAAMNLYIRVRSLLKDRNVAYDIHAYETEYHYKACRKLRNICRYHIDDNGMAETYAREIETIKKNLETRAFKALSARMFGDEAETMQQQMTEELAKKIRSEKL